MRRLLATGLVANGPFSLRFPRGSAPAGGDAPFEPVEVGRARVLRTGSDVLIAGAGKLVAACQQAADLLAVQGIEATVIDARFVKPIDPRIPELAAAHRAVVTVEDGTARGGFGTGVLEAMAVAGVAVPTRVLGLPDAYIEHGAQPTLLGGFGLDEQGIVAAVLEVMPLRSKAALAG
jgi:1-deoxy-D-xylulose-5-phosphate synthase